MKRIYAAAVGLTLTLFLFACGVVQTSPFGERSLILIPTSQEVAIGRAAALQIERRSKMCKDPVINGYVNWVGQRIAAVCGRHDIEFHYKVIESPELNAFSLPGGWVYIYTGLLKHLKDEADLAFVLGHETGHIVGRHAIRRLQLIYGINLLLSLTLGGKNLSPIEEEVLKVLYQIVIAGYSRKEEFEADAMGAYFTGKAGWNPVASVETIQILDSLMKFKPSGVTELFMDHPTNKKRIANLERWIRTFPKSWLRQPFNAERYREKVLRRLNGKGGDIKRRQASTEGGGRNPRSAGRAA
ncbi:M48 family metallopeptidase [Thermovibrio ammonificans]|uniref:Peptidase M48 Ste24p n=1 Tax=Thermovibrio ammonificans (strain DSM 15698 / JCM 12110 / HB-1) TaxID=648996 RepID=E8T599_THEA1|nr:M48 family metallopeptidase [Thermovibrio ammonificans]ADU96437.1 peptidase M48 Ste24p [Thermovibrio ammonificans HB-1]